MDNLGSYHSKYTGEEIDAAVLAVLANLVTSFNGRPGPIIQSEVGDYSADMIAVPNLLSSSGEILTNLLDTLVDIRDNMTKYEEVSLYSDYEVSSQGNGYIFDLSESFMHFDTLRLEFIPTYSEGVTSRYNSFFYFNGYIEKDDGYRKSYRNK